MFTVNDTNTHFYAIVVLIKLRELIVCDSQEWSDLPEELAKFYENERKNHQGKMLGIVRNILEEKSLKGFEILEVDVSFEQIILKRNVWISFDDFMMKFF